MKIVIDTIIWISFLIGKLLGGLENYILNKSIEIFTTDEQILEIITVLERPKFSKYFSKEDTKELLFLIQKTTMRVEIKHQIKDCRDEKDNFILETALKGKVDYLISGDKDLLILNPYRGIKIITYRQFEDILKSINLDSR